MGLTRRAVRISCQTAKYTDLYNDLLADMCPMKDRTALAIVCLHISTGAYVLLAGILAVLPSRVETSRFTVVLIGFCLALAAVEILIVGLKRRKFWAWIVGIIVSGAYVPSLFLPLGALGLWGLFAPGSRKSFEVGASSGTEGQPASAANRSQPVVSDTNRMPPAAGSGG